MGEANGAGANGGAPVAGQLAVQVGKKDGHPVVLLVESGAMSQHQTQLSPDLADSLAELLVAGARRARLGLVLPPGN